MDKDYIAVVTKAHYKGGYRIALEFDNGVKKIVDFEQWLDGPIFQPLKDIAYFKKFKIAGGTVAWPNGADIAPETLLQARAVTSAD